MLPLALVAVAAFVLTGATVGVRMLLLARRTGSLPELLLGTALATITFVTIPCVALSLGLQLGSRELQHFLFGLGLLPVAAYAMCLCAFTAQVFRAGHRWPRVAVLLAGLTALAGVVGTVLSRTRNWDADRVVSAEWNVLMVVPIALAMTWTGVESLILYRQHRRRLALGLADPVVCDRFRLWAIGNLGSVAATLLVPFSLLMGWRLVSHPVPILGIAAAGLSLSVAWLLAFLPPRWYLQRIRGPVPAT